MIDSTDSLGADRLLEAFALFNDTSQQLVAAYSSLQAEVQRLSSELATANQRLREELLAKEALSQRLTLLLEMLPGAVLLTDRNDTVLQMNPAAQRLLGTQELGWIWPHWSGLQLAEGGSEALLDDQGQVRRLAIAVTPLEGEGGRILLLQDVTASRAREAAARRRERLAAMGETMAGLAHQLRTPLATALLAVGQVQPGSAPERLQRQRDRALDRLRHLQGVVDAMLSFLRDGLPAEGAMVSMTEIAQGLQQEFLPLFRQKNVNLLVESMAADWILAGSREAWVSVLGNLVQNALDFSPPKGEVRVAGFLQGESLLLRISDQGSGIAAAQPERIFEPFVSSRSQGTGLGLSIARNFIEAMGGWIRIESTGESGTIFCLELPLLRLPRPLQSGA